MYTVIPLTNDGEGHVEITLGDQSLEFVTRFNYTTKVWSLEIIDTLGVTLTSGIALVPQIDLLTPYLSLKNLIGSLLVVEQNEGDYQDPDLLGYTVQLLWYAPGTPVVFP